jgi:hypothetical protein
LAAVDDAEKIADGSYTAQIFVIDANFEVIFEFGRQRDEDERAEVQVLLKQGGVTDIRDRELCVGRGEEPSDHPITQFQVNHDFCPARFRPLLALQRVAL